MRPLSPHASPSPSYYHYPQTPATEQNYYQQSNIYNQGQHYVYHHPLPPPSLSSPPPLPPSRIVRRRVRPRSCLTRGGRTTRIILGNCYGWYLLHRQMCRVVFIVGAVLLFLFLLHSLMLDSSPSHTHMSDLLTLVEQAERATKLYHVLAKNKENTTLNILSNASSPLPLPSLSLPSLALFNSSLRPRSVASSLLSQKRQNWLKQIAEEVEKRPARRADTEDTVDNKIDDNFLLSLDQTDSWKHNADWKSLLNFPASTKRNQQQNQIDKDNALSSNDNQNVADLLPSDPSSLLGPATSPPNLSPSDLSAVGVEVNVREATPKNRRFSTTYCIGNRGRLGAADDTSCRFQNLCYDLSSFVWQFYQDPDTSQLPLLTLDRGEIFTDFPIPLLNLRSMGLIEDAQYWSPSRILGEIPTGPGVFWPRRSPSMPDVHILYHGHYPSNIGHILGDDLFPIYNLMRAFNLLTSSAQLLTSRNCRSIFPRSQRKLAQCEDFMDRLPRGLTDRAVLSLAGLPQLLRELHVPSGSTHICFDNLLAGLSQLGFQQSVGRADQWHEFHNFYLGNMGINPRYRPTEGRLRIAISVKAGNRGFYNTREFILHLKDRFQDPSGYIEIVPIELKSFGSWKKELQFLQDVNILITPCGGVSMSGMFLPKGAAIIIVDYYNTKLKSSVGMEDRLWSNIGYLRSYHYPFFEKEVYLPEYGEWKQKFSRTSFKDMRGYGQVKIDLHRMDTIIESAIQHVQHFMYP